MKLNKRKVFVVALAICLVAVLSFGTLAWFTDSDSVTNNFMTATSDDDTADDVFNVDIYETVKNDDGSSEIVVGKDTVGGDYTYDGVLPGDKLVKAPVVANTGEYAQFVRVKVTVSDAAAWTAIFADYGYELENLFVVDDQFDNRWDREIAETTTDNDAITFVYYYKDVLEAGASVNFFDAVTLPGELTKEDLINEIGADGFSITLVAEAIQSANTGATAQEAFTKF